MIDLDREGVAAAGADSPTGGERPRRAPAPARPVRVCGFLLRDPGGRGHRLPMLDIRPAVAADAPVVLALIRELAEYEREPDAVVASVEDLVRDGFGEKPRFHVLLASWDGEPVGFALYVFAYSTWRGRAVLHLEDLFVRPVHRKKRVGISLMQRLAQIAVDEACARFVWQVLDWNEPAIQFYESLGARVLREWLTVRIEGDAIRRLAERAPA